MTRIEGADGKFLLLPPELATRRKSSLYGMLRKITGRCVVISVCPVSVLCLSLSLSVSLCLCASEVSLYACRSVCL